ncbi:MAG TPA: hypothetical protein VK588_14290 [Chitinophagaceae bacterium]|nr:hypothetical protein [Chitinophagaceae bacterium]
MKNTKNPAMVIFLFGMISSALSQTNPVMDKKMTAQFDIMLMEMKKIDVTKSEEVKRAIPIPSPDQIFDATLPALKEEIEQGKIEIETKSKHFVDIKSSNIHEIDKDLLALMSGIPEPIIGLSEAKRAMNLRDEEIIYNIYIEKLKRLQAQFIEEARKYVLKGQDAEQIRAVAEKNAAKAMQDLNNNSLVQQAGGLEKLQQMTPEERAAWGKKMAEQVKNNPSAYTGTDSDPRKAFANKMMKDPNYAARFQHMNQQQQQEEYKMFMSENGFVDNEAGKSAEIKIAHNEATITIAITQRTTDILNHRKQLAGIAGAAQKKTDDYFVMVNSNLNDQYRRIAESLPVVDHGEAGKGKDTYPVDLAYNLIVYTVERENAISNKEVWKNYMEAMKGTIAEYNAFLSEYWGRDKQTDQLMAKQNQTPPAIMAGACGDLIWLTEMAKTMTHSNAGWQRTYDEKILHLYEER